ncbi:MAG: hypothetical protein VX498_10975 [Myxococcota bacterium]|nr:hypothetical protein [Myxococcota bacterium]
MNFRQQAEHAVFRALRVACEDETLQPRPGDHLQHDLALDSMGFLQLAIDLENFLDAPLGEDPEHLPETVLDLVELVFYRMEIQADVA